MTEPPESNDESSAIPGEDEAASSTALPAELVPDEASEKGGANAGTAPPVLMAEIVEDIGPRPSKPLPTSKPLPIAVRFLILGGGFFALQLALVMIVGIGYVAFLLFSERLNPEELQRLDVEQLTLPMTIIAAVPLVMSTLLLVLACRRYLDRRDFASMGFFLPSRGMIVTIVGGLLAGIAPIAAAVAIVYFAGGYRFEGFSWSVLALLLIPTLVLMAFQEEILFRSYIYQNILEVNRPITALWFSSLVFWLVHAANPNAWSSPLIGVNLFGAGVLLALAYRLSRDIWFPSAMHFGWNFAQGVLFSIPISGIKVEGFVVLRESDALPTWLTGGEFGLEGSLVTVLIQVVVISIMAALLMRRRATAAAPAAAAASPAAAD